MAVEQSDALVKAKTWEEKTKDMYESFWLISESHPARLGVHITLRGVYSGALMAAFVAVPVLAFRKKATTTTVMRSLGRATMFGGIGGGALLSLVAAERLYHLDAEGVSDRSFRLAYNWGQTKWDILSLEGAVLSGLLMRRPLGGALPAAMVGTVLATSAWATGNLIRAWKARAK